MKIYMVRHAQSLWQLKASDNLDSPLSSVGHEQAARLGEWLAEHSSIDSCFRVEVVSLCASPLVRAQETGRHVAAALNLPLITLASLSEANFQVSSHLPQYDSPLGTHARYELSDVYANFKRQALSAMRRLVEQAQCSKGPVLAITHGALIETVLRGVIGNDAISFSLYNSTLNLIEWKRGRWHLELLNCWDHLPQHLRTT